MAEGATVKRLSKVAREFNVGINTLVEYLSSKGVQVESNPNTKIDGETYNILVGEFQSEKSAKEESKKVSIGTEKETISIEPIEPKEEPKVESPKEESPAASEKGKDEEIKVVGKIDLSTLNLKTRPDKKPKQKEEPKVEAPKKEEPKAEKPAEKPVEKVEEKEEEKPAASNKREEIETVYEKITAPKVLGKIELPVNKPKTKAKPVASSEGGADASKKKRKRLPRKVDVDTNAKKNTGRTPFKKGEVELRRRLN